MAEILSIKKAIKIARKIHSQNKTIVIAGGCFDILHAGHIKFLENAKKAGNVLFVLVESDSSVRSKKGPSRPVNKIGARLTVLSAIKFIDYLIPLAKMTKDEDYDTLMAEISPNIIATTNHDPNVAHKERQAKKIGAKVKYVTTRVRNISTTRLANLSEI